MGAVQSAMSGLKKLVHAMRTTGHNFVPEDIANCKSNIQMVFVG